MAICIFERLSYHTVWVRLGFCKTNSDCNDGQFCDTFGDYCKDDGKLNSLAILRRMASYS